MKAASFILSLFSSVFSMEFISMGIPSQKKGGDLKDTELMGPSSPNSGEIGSKDVTEPFKNSKETP